MGSQVIGIVGLGTGTGDVRWFGSVVGAQAQGQLEHGCICVQVSVYVAQMHM